MASPPQRGRWSAQFLGMLEALGMGARFQSGRRYARSGQVLQLTISTNLVSALVRDEEHTYRARIAARGFAPADWGRVERRLAGQAYYAAKLLAGQVPDDIEAVFAEFGLALLPDIGDLAMDCSCPGWQVPCTHLIAACYVLAESFDADPFGMLAWRGRGRDELLERLRGLRPLSGNPPGPSEATTGRRDDRAIRPGGSAGRRDGDRPLADYLDGFWAAGPLPPAAPSAVPGGVRRPDALLEQLDPPRLYLGRLDVTDLLRPAYEVITRDG